MVSVSLCAFLNKLFSELKRESIGRECGKVVAVSCSS